jgi:outer membrane receptor protein involved in Fe transport
MRDRMLNFVRFVSCSAVIVYGLLPTLIAAQSTSASLSGTVTDSSRAVVPGATVDVLNNDTGTHRRATTNGAGIYSVPVLPPGNYTIEVEKAGFKDVKRPDVVLHVQDAVDIPFVLSVGSSTETVTVTAGAPILNTQDATVGTVVDRQFVDNMPLNGRSFQALIQLTPGTVVSAATGGEPGQFSINGQRPDANYFTVDGVSANVGVAGGGSVQAGAFGSGVQASAAGGYNNLVSVDAMQEFKVQTSSFAPEYGQTPGGQISIATRSGTNQFHGAAFDYLRNSDFDANDWVFNSGNVPRAPLHQNDFGGVLGGPVWKNKLFFFGSYEGLRVTLPGQLLVTDVPTTCARGQGGCTGSNVPAIPAIQPFLAAFPEPSQNCNPAIIPPSTDPAFGTLCAAYSNKISLDSYGVRVDYNVNAKTNLFARWNRAPSQALSRNVFFTDSQLSIPNISTFTAGLTYTLNPTMSNDFRFNYSSLIGHSVNSLDTFGGAIPVSNSLLFPSNVKTSTGGPIGPGNSAYYFELQFNEQWIQGTTTQNQVNQLDFVDNFSWVHGPHQLKFGVDLKRLTPVQARRSFETYYDFPDGPSMLAGNFDFEDNGFFLPVDILVYNLGIYAQDAWKVNPRLTITYGLRWNYNPAPSSTNNIPFVAFNSINVNNPNPNTSVISPVGPPVYQNQWNGFAPRVGVAYQLSQDPKWARVIRAGWGLFYDTTGDALAQLSVSGQQFYFCPFIPPFCPSGSNDTFPLPTTGLTGAVFDPTITLPTSTVFSAPDPKLRLPYVHEMNVAFEQSLGTQQAVTLTYAGAIGRHLFVTDVFPAGSSTNLTNGYAVITNQGSSDYHSLQALFRRRLTHGLQAMASYTWSHSVDTGSAPNYLVAIPAIEPLSQERGPSDFDIRHTFQMATSYDIPHFGSSHVANALLGHWGADVLFRARTAPPINVIDPNAYLSPGVSSTYAAGVLFQAAKIAVRPNVASGQPFYLHGSQCAAAYSVTACPGGMALNPLAFTGPLCQVASGGRCYTTSQGTLGRNALRGYGFNQLDLTLRREFPIHERLKLQFRADAFNVLNHPAFGYQPLGTNLNFTTNKAGTLTNQSFGKTTNILSKSLAADGISSFNSLYQIGGPRSLQLSLKLVF